jgi:hypothetical protein
MLERIAYYVLAILIFIFCFLIYKTYQYSLDKKLQRHVSWCVTNDSNLYRCNMSLLDWLYDVQHYSKKKKADCFFSNADKMFLIEDKYWLSGEEELSIAKEILCAYQKELSQEYFSGHLIANRLVCKLSHAEYFLLSLKDFLQKYECETTFNGQQMYITKSYKNLGSWGVPLFEATYELTDLAVVYHKMYLIAQMYCLTLRENPLDTTTTFYHSAEYTKKVLDTREMEVSRY